jgi:hypothetical protein
MSERDPVPDSEQLQLEEVDAYSQFITAVPLMVDMARYAARNESISYRVHVGASAYATSFDTGASTVLGGANYKPDKDTPKYCAEMDVLDQLEEEGYDQIIGIVIAGTTDPEIIKSIAGRATPTLHPCSVCRDKMGKSKLITPDTIFVTVDLDSDKAQVQTLVDLQLIYEMGEQEGNYFMTPAVDLDLKDWTQRKDAFDHIMRSADNDAAHAAEFVLSLSGVSLEDQ